MFKNLEDEQKRGGYSNTDMAEILGISRAAYEHKKQAGTFNRPQIETLLRLFDCKFEYLFQCDEENKEQPCQPAGTCLKGRPA